MLIRFIKLTNERHRFETVHAGRVVESRELETRSFLLHDLVHYAVEAEAGLRSSFFGRLAAGCSYDALTMPDSDAGAEAMQTERVVAIIQTASRREDWPSLDETAFAARLVEAFRATAEDAPAWLTADLVARVRERLRRVLGQWRATPYGLAMELEF